VSEIEAVVQRLRADFLRLDVRPGGCLLVHSSLRALGPLPGGPETVIAGLEAALGPQGTLLMPALSYAHVTPDHPVFDLLATPSNVGLIPETFRRQPGTLRSLHPTHSVCARGKLADELTCRHGDDATPCGPNSPFSLLPERDGQVLMLGCGLEPNTSMHAVEERIEPPYLFDPPLEYTLILLGGERRTKIYRPHNFRGWRQRYDRLELPNAGLARGFAAEAECFLLDARVMWAAALERLRLDPLAFVEKETA
jgi:aminoglycoside 3-N-acetyltransferase